MDMTLISIVNEGNALKIYATATDLSQFSSKIHHDLYYYIFGIFLNQLFQFFVQELSQNYSATVLERKWD